VTHLGADGNETVSHGGENSADGDLNKEIGADQEEEHVGDDILAFTGGPFGDAGEEDGKAGEGKDGGIYDRAGDGGHDDGEKGILLGQEAIEKPRCQAGEGALKQHDEDGFDHTHDVEGGGASCSDDDDAEDKAEPSTRPRAEEGGTDDDGHKAEGTDVKAQGDKGSHQLEDHDEGGH